MRFSDLFLKKFLTIARITDKHPDIKNQQSDVPGQQFFPDMITEEQTKDTQKVKALAFLEDQAWEAIDNLDDITELEDYEPSSDEISDEASNYVDNMDSDLVDNVFDSYPSSKQDEIWQEFILEKGEKGALSSKQFLYVLANIGDELPDSYVSYVLIPALKSVFSQMDVIRRFEQFFGEPVDEEILMSRDSEEDLRLFINSKSKEKVSSALRQLIPVLSRIALSDVEEAVFANIGETILSDANLVYDSSVNSGFIKWLADEKIDSGDIHDYVVENMLDSITESISENHREYMQEDAGEIIELLEDIEKGIDPELNELFVLDDYMQNGNYNYDFKVRRDWEDTVSPILDEARKIYNSLPEDIRENMMPQSNRSMRMKQRQLANDAMNYARQLGREVTIEEVKRRKPELEKEVAISRGKAQLFQRLAPNRHEVTDEEFQYYVENPNYPDEYNALFRELGISATDADITFEEFKNLKANPALIEQKKQQIQYQRDFEEAKEFDTDFTQNREKHEYKKKVEKQVQPLSDQNKQLMINIVQKLQNKGNVDKNSLQQFFTKYTTNAPSQPRQR